MQKVLNFLMQFQLKVSVENGSRDVTESRRGQKEEATTAGGG